MAVTTRHAVYRGLVDRLEAQMSIDNAFIYVAPRPIFSPDDIQFVQIVPGVGQTKHPVSGVGLVVEDFEVACWSRFDVDQANQSTRRITDATNGLQSLSADVRQALIEDMAETGSPTLTIPVTLIQGSSVSESEAHPGWAFLTETFRMGYEVTWSVPT